MAEKRTARQLAKYANRAVLKRIEEALRKVNPKYELGDHNFDMNCTHCVQAYEFLRRGFDVEATALPKQFHPNPRMCGGGGRPLSDIEGTWGRSFTDGSQHDIVKAFEQSGPGSRGVVAVQWKDGGGHVFNVENVGGKVHFLDGQNNTIDASKYFGNAMKPKYVRLDDLPTPPGVIPYFAS